MFALRFTGSGRWTYLYIIRTVFFFFFLYIGDNTVFVLTPQCLLHFQKDRFGTFFSIFLNGNKIFFSHFRLNDN